MYMYINTILSKDNYMYMSAKCLLQFLERKKPMLMGEYHTWDSGGCRAVTKDSGLGLTLTVLSAMTSRLKLTGLRWRPCRTAALKRSSLLRKLLSRPVSRACSARRKRFRARAAVIWLTSWQCFSSLRRWLLRAALIFLPRFRMSWHALACSGVHPLFSWQIRNIQSVRFIFPESQFVH